MIIKKTMYIDLPEYGDIDRPDTWFLWNSKAPCDTCLGEVELQFEFDVPSHAAVRDKKIAKLKAEAKQVRADAQIEIERLEDKIQQLMAIGADDD